MLLKGLGNTPQPDRNRTAAGPQPAPAAIRPDHEDAW